MKTRLLSLLVILNCSVKAQVINGSFEDSSGATLTGWNWICGAQSFNDSPSAGGWCIKVNSGNTQGCFPGYAYQVLPFLYNQHGADLYCQARAEISSYIGLYIGTINNGTITLLIGDTTSSATWQTLWVHVPLALTNDTLVVVLFGGLTGGPVQGYGYFDMVDYILFVGTEELYANKTLTIFPQPFTSLTHIIIPTNLKNPELKVWNTNGECVRHYENLLPGEFILRREELPTGIYLLKLFDDKNNYISKAIVCD